MATAEEPGVRVTLLSRRIGVGEGASGYAAGLVRGLEGRGVDVDARPSRRGPLGYALRSLAVRGPILSLERTLRHDIFRAGGGVHRVYRRHLGIRRVGVEDGLEQRAVAVARRVVANSSMVADQLHRELGVPWERIEVVRTGVDAGRFRGRGASREAAVLFAGNGWTRKGFEVAAEAVARVGRPLWVAGRDARRRRRLRRASRSVHLRDLGERVDLATVLPRVSAVVHPTRYDAASNLVLEALACGTPIVTSRQDGSHEVLPEALVVDDPRDVARVARCLRHALEHPSPVLEAIAESWPESRNHDRMHTLLMECIDG